MGTVFVITGGKWMFLTHVGELEDFSYLCSCCQFEFWTCWMGPTTVTFPIISASVCIC